MCEILAQDWLHHHSGRLAQDHAVRLCAFCAALYPTDKNLFRLVEEQVKTELIGLAIHGRRTMERHDKKDPPISNGGFWPSSNEATAQLSLWEAFGRIIHANSIEVGWECVDKLDVYKGRETCFAGHVAVTSDKGTVKLPTGRVAASFIGFVLNKTSTSEVK